MREFLEFLGFLAIIVSVCYLYDVFKQHLRRGVAARWDERHTLTLTSKDRSILIVGNSDEDTIDFSLDKQNGDGK